MKSPNILLVVLDATRVDHCSCYREGPPLTPVLDQLAAEGVLFERAFACAPWTLPAMASILTGLHSAQTGVESQRRLPSSLRTLPSHLKERGYSTLAITKNSWFSAEFGLTQGFDTVHKLWQIFQTEVDLTEVSLTNAYPGEHLMVSAAKRAMQGNWLKNALNLVTGRIKVMRNSDYGARHTFRPVQQWISKQTGPWFALVHYLEAHLEYKPPMAWAKRYTDNWPLAKKLLAADQLCLCYRHITGVEPMDDETLRVWRQLYTAEVAYQDHAMGQLIKWLRQTGRADATLIIVVADHGESLGEHRLVNHLYGLYDPLIHVPLVLCGPGVTRGQRVREMVQTNDIFGTVLAATGAPLPAGAHNLLENGCREYVVAEYGQPRVPRQDLLSRFALQAEDFAPYMRSLITIRTDQHKLIIGSDGSQELFDLFDDPQERVNLAATAPTELAAMQQLLHEWQSSVGATGGQPVMSQMPESIDPKVEAQLKALGYLD